MSLKKCKVLPEKGKVLHFATTDQDQPLRYERAIALALRRELSGSRNTAKILMRWTGAGGRTVRNWLGGIRGPSGHHLISLMGESNEVFRTVLLMARRLPDPQLSALDTARLHAVELLKILDGVFSAPEPGAPPLS